MASCFLPLYRPKVCSRSISFGSASALNDNEPFSARFLPRNVNANVLPSMMRPSAESAVVSPLLMDRQRIQLPSSCPSALPPARARPGSWLLHAMSNVAARNGMTRCRIAMVPPLEKGNVLFAHDCGYVIDSRHLVVAAHSQHLAVVGHGDAHRRDADVDGVERVAGRHVPERHPAIRAGGGDDFALIPQSPSPHPFSFRPPQPPNLLPSPALPP